jgi:hypothetical protein
MRVQWALACQEIETDDNALAHARGIGVDAVFVSDLHATVTLITLVRIAAGLDEIGKGTLRGAHAWARDRRGSFARV